MLHKIGLVAVAALFSFAVPANANTYDFTYTGGPQDSTVRGSGVFTTNSANLVISGSGTFSIDSVSGQGTTLFPVTADTAGLSSDNVYPIDSAAGLLFQGTSNTNFFANIFAPTNQTLSVGTSDAWFSASNGAGYLLGSLGFAGVCSNCVAYGSLTITAVSASPLPASWGMMILGLGVLGFMGFRAKPRTRMMTA